MSAVLDYLSQKGMSPRRVYGDEANYLCWFHDEPDGKRGRLYINISDDAEIKGLFQCKVCDQHGSLVSLKRWFGDATETDEREDDGFIRRAIFERASLYYHDSLLVNDKVMDWLKSARGLTNKTIINHRLGFGEDGLLDHLRSLEFRFSDILATGLAHENKSSGKFIDYFDCHLIIPYFTSGNVVWIRGRDLRNDANRKYTSPPGQKVRLFNSDVTWDAKEIMVAEGEIDCMVLEQLGFTAVAAPGATSWQDSWNGYFEDAKRVYVMFDSDKAGRDGAEKVANKIGSKARKIFVPGEGMDVSDWVIKEGHSVEDFRKLIGGASGGLLVTVDEAYEEHSRIQGQEGIQTGWKGLDRLLKPGLMPAQVMIVLAKTNVGKTIWLLNLFQLLCMMQPEAKILFCSLEQTRGEWFERAKRIYRFYNHCAPDSEVLDFWRDRLLIIDKNRLSYGQLREAVDDFDYQTGSLPTIVAIDYLGYWARSFKGAEYERLSDAIMAMKEFGKEADVTLVVPHQVNRTIMNGTPTAAEGARGCVAGSTLIPMANGDMTPIRELVGRISPVVHTINDHYQLTHTRAAATWSQGVQHTLKLTTQTGRVIEATADHPLLTAERGWVPLGDLQIGDRVATSLVPSFGSSNVEHAELLGFLIGDGGLTTSPLTFSKGEIAVVDHVELLAKEFGVSPTRNYVERDDLVRLFLSNDGGTNPLTQWICSLGLNVTSPKRFVPKVLMQANRQSLSKLLRGLWSTDGCVMERGIRFSSASERLARDVQHLIGRFGVHSILVYEPNRPGVHLVHGRVINAAGEGGVWNVEVRATGDLQRFESEIGFVGVRVERMHKLLRSREGMTTAHTMDLFPSVLWDEIHRVRKANRLGWSVLSTTGDPKRTSIVKSRAITRERLQWLSSQVGAVRLQRLATGDLIFDKVVSILSGTDQEVFDLSVLSSSHCFVANDFVVSNSGVIEETGDFVLGLWSPDSMAGATPEERTGALNMQLHKSRHGGVGQIVPLVLAPKSLAIVEAIQEQTFGKLTKLAPSNYAQWARNEVHYLKQYPLETWEHAQMRHESGLGIDATWAKVEQTVGRLRQGSLR